MWENAVSVVSSEDVPRSINLRQLYFPPHPHPPLGKTFGAKLYNSKDSLEAGIPLNLFLWQFSVKSGWQTIFELVELFPWESVLEQFQFILKGALVASRFNPDQNSHWGRNIKIYSKCFVPWSEIGPFALSVPPSPSLTCNSKWHTPNNTINTNHCQNAWLDQEMRLDPQLVLFSLSPAHLSG